MTIEDIKFEYKKFRFYKITKTGGTKYARPD